MKNFYRDIITRIQLVEESVEVEGLDDSGRYWSIEGENIIDGSEEKYVVYDCSGKNHEFDFQFYDEKMKEEKGISHQIMIFKTWEHEWEVREEVYKSLQTASERKRLLQWFEEKIAFYTELKDSVILNVEEDGVNYLQYEKKFEDSEEYGGRGLKSRIYNVSFEELKKIFNVTGKDLFRKNVRYGLRNNRTGNDIQTKFKEYIKVGAYVKWIKEHPEEKDSIEIKNVFEIEEDYAIHIPENFWFYHNGVTIFYYGKESINFSGSHIELNPKEVSVINGAQTLTNFFEGIKTLPEEFAISCSDLIEEETKVSELIKFLKEYIKLATVKMKVKTIFIDGAEEFVQPITYGLNTQIPIVEADIIADSEDVAEINKWLKQKNMKIRKTGETESVEIGLSVLEFVKKYLIVLGKPGKSKNLRRSDLKDYIKRARQQFEEEGNELLENIYSVFIVEMWWKSSKKDREKNYLEDNEKAYMNHGKNYFESYVSEKREEELDAEYLSLLFENFVRTFIELKDNPEIKDFKTDVLFEKYQISRMKKQEAESDITERDCDELKRYLNKTKPSPYRIQKAIIEYLHSINKEIPYFRVIARSNKKVREAFPFPNTTFSELYQGDGSEPEKIVYKSYEESCFAGEVRKVFPIFVIEWVDCEGEEHEKTREANEINFIPDFSFAEYDEKAKIVYNQTVEVFKDGNEEDFPKMKDGQVFHVRPKAVNAEDTFEFTNGKQITRRTFWANKDTMDKLIDKFIGREIKKA